jgi:hypothetical protein
MGRGRLVPVLDDDVRAVYAGHGITPDARAGTLTLPSGAPAAALISADVRKALASDAVARVASAKASVAVDKTAGFYGPSVPVYASPLHALLHPGEALNLVRSSASALEEANAFLEVLRDVDTTPAGLATATVLATYAAVVEAAEHAFSSAAAVLAPRTVGELRAGVRGAVDADEMRAFAPLAAAYSVAALRQCELVVCLLLGVAADTGARALLTPDAPPPVCPEETHHGGWARAARRDPQAHLDDAHARDGRRPRSHQRGCNRDSWRAVLLRHRRGASARDARLHVL